MNTLLAVCGFGLFGLACIIAMAQSAYGSVPEVILTGSTGLDVFLSQVSMSLPNIASAGILIAAGIIIGKLVGRATQKLVDKFSKKTLGKSDSADTKNIYEKEEYSGWIAGTIRWFIYLFFFIAAVNALGFGELSGALTDLWLWVPNFARFHDDSDFGRYRG